MSAEYTDGDGCLPVWMFNRILERYGKSGPITIVKYIVTRNDYLDGENYTIVIRLGNGEETSEVVENLFESV